MGSLCHLCVDDLIFTESKRGVYPERIDPIRSFLPENEGARFDYLKSLFKPLPQDVSLRFE